MTRITNQQQRQALATPRQSGLCRMANKMSLVKLLIKILSEKRWHKI